MQWRMLLEQLLQEQNFGPKCHSLKLIAVLEFKQKYEQFVELCFNINEKL